MKARERGSGYTRNSINVRFRLRTITSVDSRHGVRFVVGVTVPVFAPARDKGILAVFGLPRPDGYSVLKFTERPSPPRPNECADAQHWPDHLVRDCMRNSVYNEILMWPLAKRLLFRSLDRWRPLIHSCWRSAKKSDPGGSPGQWIPPGVERMSQCQSYFAGPAPSRSLRRRVLRSKRASPGPVSSPSY